MGAKPLVSHGPETNVKGSRWWPPGPSTVDWTLDLADLEFGPIRIGTSLADLKRLLGRPAFGTWFFKPMYLSYPAMNLRLDIDEDKMWGLEISWEDLTDDSGFDPRVRLGDGMYATARTLTREIISSALGPAIAVDLEEQSMISWVRGDDIVFVDLSDDGKIAGVGFS